MPDGPVVVTSDLRAQGLAPSDVEKLVVNGHLRPVRGTRGVYVLGGTVDSWTIRLDIALATAGPDAFARRRSAAVLWGLDGCEAVSPLSQAHEVGVPAGRHPLRPGVARVSVGPTDVCTEGGRRLTTPLRTIADLASVMAADELEAVIESALRQGLVAQRSLRSPHTTGGRAGARALRAVMDRRPAGAPPTDSLAETLFMQLCRKHGVAEPVRQLPQLLGRRHRLDFAWPALRVAVEIDGAAVHDGGRLAEDLRRQNAVVGAGWLLLRFTWEDITRYPEATMQAVTAALADAALRHGDRVGGPV